jgi:hypothetical protein
MTNRLMVSVAAIALIAGAGYANAQGAGAGHESGGASGGAAMHNSAPAGGAAGGGAAAGASTGGGAMEKRDSATPTEGTRGGSDMKQSQSDKASGSAKGERAEDSMHGQKSKGMSSENETKGGAKDMKAEGREGQSGNMKAEGRQDKNGNMNAESKGGNERSQTTGMAGSGAKLTTEQRTKITSVIHNVHVAPVTNVNFSVSVGTRVPRDVEFHPLPAEVVTVYPEWRGYNFILVRDEIVVIDPNTYEIIAVINS